MTLMLSGADIVFWICAPLAIIGALGLVTSSRTVYSAMSVALTMLSLAVIYASLDAPFLFVVQIIVYTGAVMMMFLFVLMMVGVDKPESLAETIKGHRGLSFLAGAVALFLVILGILHAIKVEPAGMYTAEAKTGSNVLSLAQLIFGQYVFAFELTSALLITAALGAMVLTHINRLTPKPGQKERAMQRMQAYQLHGEHPGTKPNSGVYAASNSIAMPGLLPDGSISEESLSPTLVMREEMQNPERALKASKKVHRAIETAKEDEI